ncbi:unnamed protein product [Ostreobium quekettii]|uniref:U-box domain-containing protein n=1 Tax=Ostreobium quekettii TaxID=121088 RepID=A0A8S1IPS7_9CHLO|nr:unnamed protein product [Ostreobium quekettii]
MADPFSVTTETLRLIVAIRDRQSQVRQNKKKCQQLIDHVRLLEAILRQLEGSPTLDTTTPVAGAFSRLQLALKDADTLIARAGSMGKVSSFINAMDTKQEFVNVSSALSMSIQGLMLAQSSSGQNDIMEIRRSISKLAQDVVATEYPLELDSRQERLYVNMRQILDQMHNGTTAFSDGRTAMYRLLEDAVGKEDLQAEQQQTFEYIAAELKMASTKKGVMEDFYLRQIQAAIDEGMPRESQYSSRKAYLCPITLQVMKTPVMIIETGVTYEKTSIENWFARGFRTCPVTGKNLASTQLVVNRGLQDAIEGWMRQAEGASSQVPNNGSIRAS